MKCTHYTTSTDLLPTDDMSCVRAKIAASLQCSESDVYVYGVQRRSFTKEQLFQALVVPFGNIPGWHMDEFMRNMPSVEYPKRMLYTEHDMFDIPETECTIPIGVTMHGCADPSLCKRSNYTTTFMPGFLLDYFPLVSVHACTKPNPPCYFPAYTHTPRLTASYTPALAQHMGVTRFLAQWIPPTTMTLSLQSLFHSITPSPQLPILAYHTMGKTTYRVYCATMHKGKPLPFVDKTTLLSVQPKESVCVYFPNMTFHVQQNGVVRVEAVTEPVPWSELKVMVQTNMSKLKGWPWCVSSLETSLHEVDLRMEFAPNPLYMNSDVVCLCTPVHEYHEMTYVRGTVHCEPGCVRVLRASLHGLECAYQDMQQVMGILQSDRKVEDEIGFEDEEEVVEDILVEDEEDILVEEFTPCRFYPPNRASKPTPSVQPYESPLLPTGKTGQLPSKMYEWLPAGAIRHGLDSPTFMGAVLLLMHQVHDVSIHGIITVLNANFKTLQHGAVKREFKTATAYRKQLLTLGPDYGMELASLALDAHLLVVNQHRIVHPTVDFEVTKPVHMLFEVDGNYFPVSIGDSFQLDRVMPAVHEQLRASVHYLLPAARMLPIPNIRGKVAVGNMCIGFDVDGVYVPCSPSVVDGVAVNMPRPSLEHAMQVLLERGMVVQSKLVEDGMIVGLVLNTNACVPCSPHANTLELPEHAPHVVKAERKSTLVLDSGEVDAYYATMPTHVPKTMKRTQRSHAKTKRHNPKHGHVLGLSAR